MHPSAAPRCPQLDLRPWLCIAAAWLSGPPATLGASLRSGATIAGTISQPVQVDIHEFDAAAGDTVILRMTGTGGATFNSTLELRAPGGWTIDSTFSFGVAQIAASLTVPGKHTVACRENQGRTGPYTLAFLRIPGYPLDAGDPDLGAIENGQTRHGQIDLPADIDAATFRARAGDTVAIRMTGTGSAAFNSAIDLRGPAGAAAASAMSYGVADLTATLTLDGLYTIVCKEYTDATGAYALSMVRLPSWPLAAPDRDIGPIAPGQIYTGTIAAPGDIDAASFAAAAGDTVRIRMQGIGAGTFDSVVELRSQEGGLLASGMSFGQAAIEHALTRSGVYSLVCREFSDATGPYAVSLDLAGGHTLHDLDGDDIPNQEELAAGTDPFDPASAFRFTQAGLEQAGLRLRWTTVGGRRYRLQAGAGPAFAAVEEIARPDAEEIEQDAPEGEPHWMEHLLPAALIQAPAAPGTRAYRIVIVDP